MTLARYLEQVVFRYTHLKFPAIPKQACKWYASSPRYTILDTGQTILAFQFVLLKYFQSKQQYAEIAQKTKKIFEQTNKIPSTSLEEKTKFKEEPLIRHFDAFRNRLRIIERSLFILRETCENSEINVHFGLAGNIIGTSPQLQLCGVHMHINNFNTSSELGHQIHPSVNQKALPTNQEAGFGTNVQMTSDETFEEIINKSNPTFVMFYASWCPGCSLVKPAFSRVATNLKGTVNVIAIDAAGNPKVADYANIDQIPNFKLYVNGMQLAEYEGDRSYEHMLHFIAKNSPK